MNRVQVEDGSKLLEEPWRKPIGWQSGNLQHRKVGSTCALQVWPSLQKECMWMPSSWWIPLPFT